MSRLLQKGYPVVPGFVVSAQMFREFLETIDWSEPLFADLPNSSLHLDIENPQQLRTIAQRIRQAINSPALPTDWISELVEASQQLTAPVLALRPSLTVQKTSRISVPDPVAIGRSSALFNLQVCRNSEADLVRGLKFLWAELFGAKSLFYWQRSRIPLQQVRLAVLVQPLYSAIAAGTVQAQNESFEIQSTNGLGMAITWGEVIPDTYRVHAESGAVQTQSLGSRTIAYEIRNSETNEAIDNSQVEIRSQPAETRNLSAAIHRSFPSVPPHSASREEQNPTVLTAHTTAFLRAYLLSEEQQKRHSLDDQQIGNIVQLARNLVAEIGIPFDLEWILSGGGSSEPQLYITQIIPKPPLAANHQESYRVERHEQTLSFGSKKEEPDDIPTGSHLLLTGLAAAGGRAIARARVITQINESFNIQPGTVLVAATILPHWLLLIKQAAAIVTEQGTITSHSAIVAREARVPAVMGAANATQYIQTGDLLVVDGNQGKVYWIDESFAGMVLENTGKQEDAGTRGHGDMGTKKNLSASPRLPLSASSPTASPIRTQLMVNLSQPESLERLTGLPVNGVGLLRSELLAIAIFNQQHPNLWLQQGRGAEFVARLAESLCQFAAALSPRPVYYRSLDFRSHEFRELPGGETLPREVNPMLGVRGTFSYAVNPALFDLELAALAQVQQSGYQNVHLMLPFVRTVEEFRFCHQRIVQTGLKRSAHFQLWIMAEVPSVLFLVPEYVKAGVQGISIGTNDLTQLLLGVDRDHPQMATAFEERHPAVKSAIAHLIQQATQAGIPCSICGQAPSRYPELVEDLVRWGITSISVELDAVEPTYEAIVRAEQIRA